MRIVIQAGTIVNPRTVALLFVVAFSCAQKPASNSSTEPAIEPAGQVEEADDLGEGGEATEADEPTDASIISLTSLTITQEGRPIARLWPDGRTEGTEPDSSGKPAHFVPGPTLRADGIIILTKGGFTGRVERDGKIYVVAPAGDAPREHLFGRIVGNQLVLANSEQPWTVRVDGDTIQFNGPGFPNKIEGTLNATSRHTALVMTAAFFLDMSITAR